MPTGKSIRFLFASKIKVAMQFPDRIPPFHKCGKALQSFANIDIQAL
jgi:hypothetical protein